MSTLSGWVKPTWGTFSPRRHGRTPDLTGFVFGNLTVVMFAGSTTRNSRWLCICSCGDPCWVLTCNLKNGNSTKCNSGVHRRKENPVRADAMYNRCNTIIQRCTNKNHISYPNYGARGIKCELGTTAKQVKAAILSCIGAPPHPKLDIDRIDNDGNYAVDNIRWATRKENMNNRARK